MADDINVEQTLHGYGDGHQLLAGSVELGEDQLWQMLVMSDLSGPTTQSGFESYLTGYPVVGAGYYCLARTWLAPEMPRPGCVWTHSLLIRETDIGSIRDFRPVLDLFRRPVKESRGDTDNYLAPIVGRFIPEDEYSFEPRIARQFISLAYGWPKEQVVVYASSAQEYEQLLLALLNQQWPRLRRNFKFSTGALAIRDVLFDVAISPLGAAINTSEESRPLIATAGQATSEDDTEWVGLACDDLFQREPGRLRQHLWNFGPDYPDGRTAYRGLCEVFLATSAATQDFSSLLTVVSSFSPDPNASKRLKLHIFGPNGCFAGSAADDASLLRALVGVEASRSLPIESLDLPQRARALALSDLTESCAIAGDALTSKNDASEKYLEGFSAAFSEAAELAGELPTDLVSDVLQRQPQLLESPILWRRAGALQEAFVDIALAHYRKRNIGAVASAILDGKSWCAFEKLMTIAPDGAIDALAEWIDNTQGKTIRLPAEVYGLLAEHQESISSRLHDHAGPRTLTVLTAVLDPFSRGARSFGIKTWGSLAGKKLVLSAKKQQVRSMAFLLRIGLSANHWGLIIDTFSPVYLAAASGEMPEELWDTFLADSLPWYRPSWDKCGRLTRGIVKKILKSEWRPEEFVATFITEEQFSLALREARRTYKGTRFLDRLCSLRDGSDLKMRSEQRRVLSRYCDSIY